MIIEHFKKMPELGLLALCFFGGMAFFALTDPATLPPGFLMVGFLIILGIIFSLLQLVGKLSGLRGRLKPGQYRGLLFVGSVLPVLLLALQSLGQLTARDMVTMVLLFSIGYFYISRTSSKN